MATARVRSECAQPRPECTVTYHGCSLSSVHAGHSPSAHTISCLLHSQGAWSMHQGALPPLHSATGYEWTLACAEHAPLPPCFQSQGRDDELQLDSRDRAMQAHACSMVAPRAPHAGNAHAYAHAHAHAHMHMRTHAVRTHACKHKHACAHACMHVHTYEHTHTPCPAPLRGRAGQSSLRGRATLWPGQPVGSWQPSPA